ncbi:hypothetical protein WKH31_19150 [Metabacillus indicus]|uniref:hypothetical protein n=1 Tax=Metabacillus indicus TaxID=246786 RepID=UPI003176F6A4
MKKIIISMFIVIILNGCSQFPNPIKELRKDDILKYGISYETEKLLQLGVEGILIDKEGTIHIYVLKITPNTKSEIENGLIEIFGQKFDFMLHESKELNVEPGQPN